MFKRDSIQRKLKERFHVTPKVGSQFTGLLVEACFRVFTFADVKVDGDSAAGLLFIDRADVAYLQLIEGNASQ